MKRMRKPKMKWICLFLSVLTLLSGLSVSAWNGDERLANEVGYSAQRSLESDLNERDLVDIKRLQGEPSDIVMEEDWYCITDAEGLIRFSELVNSKDARFSGLNVCLKNNIDMSGVTDFTPIGNNSETLFEKGVPNGYHGTFDGCGYQINGLQMSAEDSGDDPRVTFVSLFGVLRERAVVRNLVIGETCSFSYRGASPYSCTAALAGRIVEGVKIENILSLASVSGGYHSGGLIARSDNSEQSPGTQKAELLYCSNAGAVDGIHAAGGLIGSCSGNLSIRYSKNSGAVSLQPAKENAGAGGMIGTVNSVIRYPSVEYWEGKQLKVNADLDTLINSGNITSDCASGSMAGWMEHAELDGSLLINPNLTACRNEGSVCEAGMLKPLNSWIGKTETDAIVSNCTDRSDEVRLHGSQVRVVKDHSYDVRLIGSLSSAEAYREVGFYVTIVWNGKEATQTLKCNRVFSSMTAGADQEIHTAESLRGSAQAYLYAMTIEDIPMNAGTMVFRVTPYGIRNGEETPEVGEETVFAYCSGEYVPMWERADAKAD